MIAIKNEQELFQMRQACKITAAARALAGEMVKPGVSTKEIDRAVYEFIVGQGAKPSFLHYNGFPNSTCISVIRRSFTESPAAMCCRKATSSPWMWALIIRGFMAIAQQLMPAEKFPKRHRG